MGIRCIAPQHLLPLVRSDTLAFDQLQIAETVDKFVLNSELDLHTIFCAFFDGERLRLEILKSSWLGEIDNNIIAAGNFKSKLENDNLERIL